MLSVLFDEDFPDPSVVITDGSICLFATQNEENTNIQLRHAASWDGPWVDGGGALAREPGVRQERAAFWAPHPPIRVGDQYRLYYSTDSDGTGLGIAMATASTLTGPYQPAPCFIRGHEYAVIDPFVLRYAGAYWLYWGSMHEPIRCRQLAPNGCEFVEGSQELEVLRPGQGPFERLIEGFWLEYHPTLRTWFAFVSGNNTWDKDDYAVTCYRSASPFGPFERAVIVVEPSTDLWAPGQCSIAVHEGTWYFVCHAVLPQSPYVPGGERFKRVPCAARMRFSHGLPSLVGL